MFKPRSAVPPFARSHADATPTPTPLTPHQPQPLNNKKQICRCIPFIQRAMHLEELVTVKEMRAVVKEKFKAYKGVADERVVDRLIFKGREELEVYLTLHKQRHHAITEYFDPVLQRKRLQAQAGGADGKKLVAGSVEAQARLAVGGAEAEKAPPSAFLSGFLQGNYPRPTAL